MAEAAVTVALSRSDADYLMQHVVQHAQQQCTRQHKWQQQSAGPKPLDCRPKVRMGGTNRFSASGPGPLMPQHR